MTFTHELRDKDNIDLKPLKLGDVVGGNNIGQQGEVSLEAGG